MKMFRIIICMIFSCIVWTSNNFNSYYQIIFIIIIIIIIMIAFWSIWCNS